MSVVEAAAETLHLHDYVELRSDGSRGTIVDTYAERGTYLVELSDDEGRTLELVPAHRKDLTLLQRVS